MRYKHKPTEVEAVKVHFPNGDMANLTQDESRPDWFTKAIFEGIICYERYFVGRWYIKTLDGNMVIMDGDYIVKGTKGELYPCKAEIFEEIYEPVESQNPYFRMEYHED